MDKATRELLVAHQAIIDAWFDAWLKREKERIDVVFAKKSRKRIADEVLNQQSRRE